MDSAKPRSPDPNFWPYPTSAAGCAAWRLHTPLRAASVGPHPHHCDAGSAPDTVANAGRRLKRLCGRGGFLEPGGTDEGQAIYGKTDYPEFAGS